MEIFGTQETIVKRRPVGGGDINDAAILTLSSGKAIFIKENRGDLEPMFEAEAAGLHALAHVAEIGPSPPVPQVLGWGREHSKAFLLMDYIEPGKLKFATAFGESLAALHRQGRSDTCGFDSDNWIGSTPQKNLRTSSWIDFFRDYRLGIQWQYVRRGSYGDGAAQKRMDTLMRRLPDMLPDVDDGQASLLHGDLWGGNWLAGEDGRAWLIDPAVYYGHREADIAMTQLFGGFPTGFFDAYCAAWPLMPGFSERRDVYNLYHLLNHVNLFGGGYWGGVSAILKRFG